MTVFRQRESINVSHVIHSVSFGEPYRGMVNPLDNQPKIIHEGSGYFQYYLKVSCAPNHLTLSLTPN